MTAAINGLSGATAISIAMKLTANADLNDTEDKLSLSRGVQWTYGTGANQVNVMWHDQRTLADEGTETINVYDGGTEKDAFGNLLTMTALKFLYIKNNSADASLRILGGTSADIGICVSNTDIIIIPPGGELLWTCPTAAGIVTTTNKNLKLLHDGTGSSSLTYDIVLMGLD
jgi:hypothetical protein